MTEMDKLHRAQLYMKQLAEGIDPVSGRELPDDTALNQVRLSRCFYYVAGLIQQIIANGGEIGRPQRGPKTRAGKGDFIWLEEFERNIAYSPQPIPVSQLAGIISQAAAESNVRKLSYARISDWLLKEGYLKSEIKNDKQFKRPTSKGEELGIFCERRTGSMGIAYDVVLYQESAQRFVVKNMKAILEDDSADAEADSLQEEARRGDSLQDMAERHHCTPEEIRRQLELLGA